MRCAVQIAAVAHFVSSRDPELREINQIHARFTPVIPTPWLFMRSVLAWQSVSGCALVSNSSGTALRLCISLFTAQQQRRNARQTSKHDHEPTEDVCFVESRHACKMQPAATHGGDWMLARDSQCTSTAR